MKIFTKIPVESYENPDESQNGSRTRDEMPENSDEIKKNTRTGMKLLRSGALSAPSGTRTLDTLIKSQVLYQLS